MKQSLRVALLTLPCFLGSIALTGCSGMGSVSIPDTPADVTPGPLTGSVFGGHSPIIGAEIYVLQAGTAYNGPSGNRLTAADAQGTDGTDGAYVLTNTSGAFSVSGDYTCTSGDPVYIAAAGGTTSPTAYLLPITFKGETGGRGDYTITFSYTGTNAPALGSPVSFASGAFNAKAGAGFTNLNGTTATVTAVGASQFSIVSDTTTKPAGTVTAYATGDSSLSGTLPNPAVINFAVLGDCPAAGNFAATVPFVFINEVSTVAGAYALNGFGTGPFDVGGTGTNLTGIQHAAETAGQMYNIGIGYNALSSTTQGINGTSSTNSTGVVPQKTLDTLANILAACVDSANTSTSASTQCTDLFADSKSATGATPTDTATAIFNIAANPGRSSEALVQNLYALQASGPAPFTPSLSAAPNDYTVTIAYTGGGLGATNGKSPHSVAVDATGNIYTVNYTSSLLNVFSPLGVPQSADGYSGDGLSHPGSVAVDSTSATVWIANSEDSNLSRFNVDGTPYEYLIFGTQPYTLRDVQIDASGNLWVTSDANEALYEVYENRGQYYAQTYTTYLSTPYGVAIDPAGDVWVANESAKEATECSEAGFNFGCTNNTSGGINYPVGNAIDANSNAWFGNSSGTLTAYTSGGTPITGSPFTTGGDSLMDGIAIDGANNVWATNPMGNALYEFSNTQTGGGGFPFGGGITYTVKEITTASGYTATSPDGIAIDGSGNVWYDTTASGTIYEVVGAATPVVTPISASVANGTLGAEPQVRSTFSKPELSHGTRQSPAPQGGALPLVRVQAVTSSTSH